MSKSFPKTLLVALVILGMSIGLWRASGVLAATDYLSPGQALFAARATLSLVWIAAAHLFNVLTVRVFWDGLVAKALNRRPPRLVVQLTNLLVMLLALSGIIGIVFQQSVTGLWATSGAIGLIVGFALRNLILDTFSGLAIHLEQPFRVGDWIICHTRMGKMAGRVEETNWRTTRLWTADSNIIVIPNSFLTSTVVTNCSLPEDYREFEQMLVLDFRVPVERALRLLNAAIRQTAEEKAILSTPAAKARVSNTLPDGVEYTISYYIRPEQVSIGKARDLLLRNVLNHLSNAGVSMSNPRRDVFLARMPWRQRDWRNDKDLGRQLARLPMFEGLSEAELDQLASRAKVYPLRKGDTVVSQGDAGDSMFIIAEGLLTVSLRQHDGSMLSVADLVPGQFFGERSLLTGEPRSATVTCAADCTVVEVGKDAIAHLLQVNGTLVEIFSRAALERELNNGVATALSEQRQLEAKITAATGPFMSRLKSFFGLHT
jgi:small-conductance mechanosensitive channel/CRP-like cAMP-binding protein